MDAPREQRAVGIGRRVVSGLLMAWVYVVLVLSWAVMEVFERRRHRRARAVMATGSHSPPPIRRHAPGPVRRDDLPAFASFHPDAPLGAVLDRELTQADVDELVREVERHLADHA